MYRLMLNLGFGLLLVLSIAIKVYSSIGESMSAPYTGDQDIVALLRKNGFATHRAAPNTDPIWTYGVRDDCRLQIADVSPQGWHRSTVEWQAAGQVLLYSAEGKVSGRQPILKPMMTHYLHRLERYVGIDAPPVPVRAIIIGPECSPDMIASMRLEVLSGA
jgi:hypothetical protein